jgi:hypothetical protein
MRITGIALIVPCLGALCGWPPLLLSICQVAMRREYSLTYHPEVRPDMMRRCVKFKWSRPLETPEARMHGCCARCEEDWASRRRAACMHKCADLWGECGAGVGQVWGRCGVLVDPLTTVDYAQPAHMLTQNMGLESGPTPKYSLVSPQGLEP